MLPDSLVLQALGKDGLGEPGGDEDGAAPAGSALAGLLEAVGAQQSNLVLAGLWVALGLYAALLAPDSAPLVDKSILEAVFRGGTTADGDTINTVFFALFNVMGVLPAVYMALLLPSGRSGNGIPAWPFIVGSFGFGAFALLPYFALWTPSAAPVRRLNRVERFVQSRANAGLLLSAAVFLVGMAATAGEPSWKAYFELFGRSKLVHVTSVDFAILTASAPFWVFHDAERRKWDKGCVGRGARTRSGKHGATDTLGPFIGTDPRHAGMRRSTRWRWSPSWGPSRTCSCGRRTRRRRRRAGPGRRPRSSARHVGGALRRQAGAGEGGALHVALADDVVGDLRRRAARLALRGRGGLIGNGDSLGGTPGRSPRPGRPWSRRP